VVNQKPVLKYPTSSVTRLFKNNNVEGHWLKVALRGKEAESNGIGSRVTVISNGIRMIREIDGGGSSHLSQNSTIAHFGLGNSSSVDSVIVTLTGGNIQTVLSPEVNALLVVEEVPRKGNFSWLFIIGFALLFAIFAIFFFRRARRK
jgi:hypothetical protein